MLIKATTVIDPTSPWHLQVVDIRIESGKITEIAPELIAVPQEEVWSQAGLHASVGWIDMSASLNEPGYEHKDDIETLCKSAAFGGFTDVATFPNTHPSIQTKEAVKFVKSACAFAAVQLHPIAALTRDTQGEQITEMIDLHHAGAIAFSDGTATHYSTAVLATSLQYLQTFHGLIIHHAQDKSLAKGGLMHEGEISTMMGTKGIPAIAEEIAVAKDISLLAYTGGRLHFSMLSTAKGIDLVRQAKAQGLQVSCDIAAHQVAFTDEDMLDFDTYLKVNPPFRSKQDIEAIWNGLADDTIDAIVSAHQPQDIESKALEFDLADFGIVGLETAFAAICSHRPLSVSIEKIIDKLTIRPRQLLGLPMPKIVVGEKACMTIFDPSATWNVQASNIQSKCKNSPFIGKTMKGKVIGIISGTHVSKTFAF